MREEKLSKILEIAKQVQTASAEGTESPATISERMQEIINLAQKMVAPVMPSSPIATKPPTLDRMNTQGQMTLDFEITFAALELEEKPLAKGGSGAVHLGKLNGEEVAVKKLTPKKFSKKQQKQLRDEAWAMAKVNSNHLVRLFGVCLEKPNYCVVMEYLPKGDLFALLKGQKKAAIPWPQRYQLGADIALGLAQLHFKKILHRDLKSLNVFLYNDGDKLRAKVGDFGFATLKQNVKDNKQFAGTMLWSDPELVRGAISSSEATDIYSLGMILWELVSHTYPYSHTKNHNHAMECILRGEKLPIPEDCPAEFAALIQECWSSDPEKRPTALNVAARLQALLSKEKEMSAVPEFKPLPRAVDSGFTVQKLTTKEEEALKSEAKVAADPIAVASELRPLPRAVDSGFTIQKLATAEEPVTAPAVISELKPLPRGVESGFTISRTQSQTTDLLAEADSLLQAIDLSDSNPPTATEIDEVIREIDSPTPLQVGSIFARKRSEDDKPSPAPTSALFISQP